MKLTSWTAVGLGLLLATLASAPAPAEQRTAKNDAAPQWSQWRGPTRDGHVPGDDWPASLTGLKMRWRVELGKGYPGPVLSDDRVFVVESDKQEHASIRALSIETGELIWHQSWPSSGKVPFFAAKNGDWVRSTPVYDGQTLYVGDMLEVVAALDGKTGEVRWSADLPERYETPRPDFGFASSPLVDDGFLYVQAANSMLKLDASNGETVWRALAAGKGMTESGAFSSPVIATLAGERQLVVQTRMTLYGLSLEDGSELWSVDVPNFRGMNILTPVIHGNSVFTSSYKNGSYLYTVSRNENAFSVEKAWENKAAAYMSSPVVVDGHAYVHLGNRRIDCIELATGESKWRSEAFGEYWSMVTQSGKILALDADGMLHLVNATPEKFQPMGSVEVADQPTWGYLAIQGPHLFVRELEAVARWDWADTRKAEAR